MKSFVYLLLSALFFTGCGSPKSPSTTASSASNKSGEVLGTSDANKTKIIVTPSTIQSGTVLRVNNELRFVVVNYPVATLPPVQTKLSVYRNGLKVAEIRITGPQENDTTIADIVAGEVRVGDQLRAY